jgi:two-component sensor histidine kinase
MQNQLIGLPKFIQPDALEMLANEIHRKYSNNIWNLQNIILLQSRNIAEADIHNSFKILLQ